MAPFTHEQTFLCRITGQRFNDFDTQARLNLDPNEHVIFIYDNAPAHNNFAIPVPYSELNKLLPQSPFLNIVRQTIRALKAATKADIHVSRPEKQEQITKEQRQDNKELHQAISPLTCYFRPYRETLALLRLLNVDSGTDLFKYRFQDV